MQVWKFQPQLDSKKHLDVSGLLHVPVRSQEWEGKEKAHHAPPANTKWHELSLHWEWQVRVSALLRGSVDIAQQHSGGGLEVSGGSGGSQSDSGNHDIDECELQKKPPDLYSIYSTMSAIAPITGILRKKIITDITIGFGCGFVLAGLYWQYEHKPLVAKREAFYAKLKAEKEAEDSV